MTATTEHPRIAVFRPDDGRAERARDLLSELGAETVVDPMVKLEPTGEIPRKDADYIILTSPAAADILDSHDWKPAGGTICAVGNRTARALETSGLTVDIIPSVYSSNGLVNALEDQVAGARVEIARSDHGSPILIAGLVEAGAYIHETVLYELVQPDSAGKSVELAARGELDAALFTSALTVEHFIDAAASRDIVTGAIDGLDTAIVGAIGEPTSDRLMSHGITADIVADVADFEVLARTVIERLDS